MNVEIAVDQYGTKVILGLSNDEWKMLEFIALANEQYVAPKVLVEVFFLKALVAEYTTSKMTRKN